MKRRKSIHLLVGYKCEISEITACCFNLVLFVVNLPASYRSIFYFKELSIGLFVFFDKLARLQFRTQFGDPFIKSLLIISTLIDELANWVLSRKLQLAGVTTKLEVKFRRPVSTRDPLITLRGRLTGHVRNYYTVHVTLHDSQGLLCDEGDVTYCMFDKERSQQMGFTACLTEEECQIQE